MYAGTVTDPHTGAPTFSCSNIREYKRDVLEVLQKAIIGRMKCLKTIVVVRDNREYVISEKDSGAADNTERDKEWIER